MTHVPCGAVTLAAAWLALGAAGCGSGKRPVAEPSPSEPAVNAPQPAAPPAAAAPDLEPSAEQLPLAEDFEAQAEQDITADNYRAALDALEKEIQSGALTK